MPDADWRPASSAAPAGGEGNYPYQQGINRSGSDPASSVHESFQHRSLHPDHHFDPFRYSGQAPPVPHGHSSSFDSSGGASGTGTGPNVHYYPHLPVSVSSAPASAPQLSMSVNSHPGQGFAGPGHPLTHGNPYPPPHPSYFPPSFWGAGPNGPHHHPLEYANQQNHPAKLPPPHHHQHHSHHNPYGQHPGHPNQGLPPPPPPPPHGLMLPPLMHTNAPRYPGQPGSAGPHPPPLPGVMMHHQHYEYITDIHPQDVLSGRGGATNSHSGNRTFRALVKEHQEQYLKAKKRDKPGVAALIVELVRKRGGRFLRRVEDMNKAAGLSGGFGYVPDPNRMPLYVDIGDERAMEKTCQALREGAPEIRRKKQGGTGASHSEDSADPKSPASSRPDTLKAADSQSPGRPSLAVALSTTSTSSLSFDMNVGSNVAAAAAGTASVRLTSQAAWTGGEQRTVGTRKRSFDSPVEDRDHRRYHGSHDLAPERHVDGPIMIRPAAKLMPGRAAVPPYPLDQLSAVDRDLYLAFLPPYPSIRTKRSKSKAAASDIGDDDHHGFDDNVDHGDDDGGGGEGGHHSHQHHASASVPSILPIVRV